LVAVEGIEPTSLDYQSSALAVELHRDLECAGRDGALDPGRGRIIFEKSIQNAVTLTGAQAFSLAGKYSPA
jgi:hypothetical protein